MNLSFLAILDYDHLDNGFFLKSFAQSLSQKKSAGLILHADSEYTERLIQTGMLREDAMMRSMKDLNHRLIALLADYGAAAIGLNGYQRNTLVRENNKLKLNSGYIKSLPGNVHLVMNTAIEDTDQGTRTFAPLHEVAACLLTELDIPEAVGFSNKDEDEILTRDKESIVYDPHKKPDNNILERIPREITKLPFACRIITAREFSDI